MSDAHHCPRCRRKTLTSASAGPAWFRVSCGFCEYFYFAPERDEDGKMTPLARSTGPETEADLSDCMRCGGLRGQHAMDCSLVPR